MIRTVLHNLISKPATRPFPARRRRPVAGYRGAVEFNRDVCVYCGACAIRCPSLAIEVDRQHKTLDFDLFKCVQCACCAEACKRGCIQLRMTYHPPVYEKPEFAFHGATVAPVSGGDAGGA